MAVKDTKLEEKEQVVVHGDILADSFRDRATGKSIAEAGESAWEREMKNRIKVDPEDSDILLVNDGFQVDNNGDATVGRDLFVEDEIVIDDLQKVVDTNGEPIIPDPSGHLNEALVHYTSGYTWKKGYELAGFQLVPKATFEGEGYVFLTGVVYIVYDTDGTTYIKYFTA